MTSSNHSHATKPRPSLISQSITYLCLTSLVVITFCQCQSVTGSTSHHKEHHHHHHQNKLQEHDSKRVTCHQCHGIHCASGECHGDYCFTGRSPLPTRHHKHHSKDNIVKGCLTGHLPDFQSLLQPQFHLCSHSNYCNKDPHLPVHGKSKAHRHAGKLLPDQIPCVQQESVNFGEIVEEDATDLIRRKRSGDMNKRFEGPLGEEDEEGEEIEAVFAEETDGAQYCHGEVCWEKATVDEETEPTKTSDENELLIISSLQTGCSNFNPGPLGGIQPTTATSSSGAHYCVSPPIGNLLIDQPPRTFDPSSVVCYCTGPNCNQDGRLPTPELMATKPVMELSTVYHLANGLRVAGPKGHVRATENTDIRSGTEKEEGGSMVTLHGPAFKVEVRVTITEAGQEHIKHRKLVLEEIHKNKTRAKAEMEKSVKNENSAEKPQSDKAHQEHHQNDQQHRKHQEGSEDHKPKQEDEKEPEQEGKEEGASSEKESNKEEGEKEGELPPVAPAGPSPPPFHKAASIPGSKDLALANIPKAEDLEKQKAFEKMDARDNKIIIAVFGSLISLILLAGLAWKCNFVGRIKRKRYENVSDGGQESLQG